jgi:hypothetical protein
MSYYANLLFVGLWSFGGLYFVRLLIPAEKARIWQWVVVACSAFAYATLFLYLRSRPAPVEAGICGEMAFVFAGLFVVEYVRQRRPG